MTDIEPEPPRPPFITEDEYRAWLDWKMPRLAREITDRLHTAGVLPEDMHFEWTERTS